MSAKLTRVLVATTAFATLVGASAALAVPKPRATITTPTAGTTISKAAGSFNVAGSGGWTTPASTTRNLYLRHAGGGGVCGERSLTAANGADGGETCHEFPAAALPIVPNNPYSEDFQTTDAVAADLPITVDASKNLTGSINVTSATPVNDMQLDVQITLGETTLPTQSFTSLGTAQFPLNIDIPDTLDKADIESARVLVIWKRMIVGVPAVTHSHIELESPASHIAIPGYTGSFNQQTHVTIDDPDFDLDPIAATVDTVAKTYSADVPTTFLTLGSHTVYVRSLQGGVAGTARSVQINVVE